MISEINRKILHAAMLRIEDCTSLALCALDTVVRIDEEEVGYICEGCILTDTISRYVGCPLIIKENLKGVK